MSDRMQTFKEKGPEEKALHVIPDGSKKAKELFYTGVEQTVAKVFEEKGKRSKKKEEPPSTAIPEAARKIFDRAIVNDDEALAFGAHYAGIEQKEEKNVRKIYVLVSARDIEKTLAEFNEWSTRSGYRYTLSNPQSARFTEADIQFLIQAGRIGFGLETEKGAAKKPVRMPKEIKEPEKKIEAPVQLREGMTMAMLNEYKKLLENNKKNFESGPQDRMPYVNLLTAELKELKEKLRDLEEERIELQGKKDSGEIASQEKKRLNEVPKINTKLGLLIGEIEREIDSYPVIISIEVKE